jgi:hypothetical protein
MCGGPQLALFPVGCADVQQGVRLALHHGQVGGPQLLQLAPGQAGSCENQKEPVTPAEESCGPARSRYLPKGRLDCTQGELVLLRHSWPTGGHAKERRHAAVVARYWVA